MMAKDFNFAVAFDTFDFNRICECVILIFKKTLTEGFDRLVVGLHWLHLFLQRAPYLGVETVTI